jgi:hypothetical protein
MLTRKQANTHGIEAAEAARVDGILVNRGIMEEGRSIFVPHPRLEHKFDYGRQSDRMISKLQRSVGMRGDDVDGDPGPKTERFVNKALGSLSSRPIGLPNIAEPRRAYEELSRRPIGLPNIVEASAREDLSSRPIGLPSDVKTASREEPSVRRGVTIIRPT